MSMGRIRLVAILAAALFFGGLLVTKADAQEARPLTPQEQHLRDFEEWRKSIPDYEWRLYERVRTIGKRQIGLQNSLIATALVVLLAIGGATFVILRRLDRGVAATGEVAQQGPSEGGPARKISLFMALRVQRRQAKILAAVKRLEDYVDHHAAFAGEFSAMAAEVRRCADELEKDLRRAER